MKTTYRIKHINSFTVQLEGFSLSKDKTLLLELFMTYPLIVLVKNNSLDLQKIKQIAKVFGDLYSVSRKKEKENSDKTQYLKKYHADESLEVIRVSNTVYKEGKADGTLGDSFINWHSDLGHTNTKFQGSLLYNKKNGDKAVTSFCHTPDLLFLIDRVDYLKLKKSNGYHTLNNRVYKLNFPDYDVLTKFKQYKTSENNQPVSKPLIIKTMRKKEALYLSPSTLKSVDNNINFFKYIKLIDKIEHYNHHWKPNDILIYDNLSLLHKRQAFTGDRILYRLNFNYKKIKNYHAEKNLKVF